MQPSADLKDEYDYYTKVTPLTNKVFKYEFKFMTVLNGTKVMENLRIGPDDYLEVYYYLDQVKPANFVDYMDFLHDAYQFSNSICMISYSGIWSRRPPPSS